MILESSPDLRENSFRIETRKQIVVGGVHHEIDIFVTVDSAPGYASTFIFECKNWAKPVNKNEIMLFGRKISLAVAQHGYCLLYTSLGSRDQGVTRVVNGAEYRARFELRDERYGGETNV